MVELLLTRFFQKYHNSFIISLNMPPRKNKYSRARKPAKNASRKSSSKRTTTRKGVSKPKRRTRIGFTTLLETPGLRKPAKSENTFNWNQFGKLIGNIAAPFADLGLNYLNRYLSMKSFSSQLGPLILKILGKDNGNNLSAADNNLVTMLINLENTINKLPNKNDPKSESMYKAAWDKVKSVGNFIHSSKSKLSSGASKAADTFMGYYDKFFADRNFNGTNFEQIMLTPINNSVPLNLTNSTA